MCNFIVPLLIASDQAKEQSQDLSLRASAILSSTTTLTNHKIMHTHNKSTSTNMPEHKQTNKHTGSSVFCFIRTSSPRCSASESVFYLYTIQYYTIISSVSDLSQFLNTAFEFLMSDPVSTCLYQKDVFGGFFLNEQIQINQEVIILSTQDTSADRNRSQ